MKKLFGVLLFLGLISPVYAADQWVKGDPQGTEASGTIDNIIRINNEATDRLLIGYRKGLGVNYATAATLSVLQGEVAIPNAAGSIVRWRRTTASTTITWADIDTGAEANSTTYYVYATADTDITGVVFKISASSSAPSGMTYYRKIASFYNNSSGNIENVQNLRNDDGTDYQDIVKGWIKFTGTGTIAIEDSFNVASVVDNGTGDTTITWSTAFANNDYAVVGTTEYLSSLTFLSVRIGGQTTSSVRVVSYDVNQVIADSTSGYVIAIGDRI